MSYEVEYYELPDGSRPAEEVILTNGFVKKTQKTPPREIEKAKQYRADHQKREES